MYTSFDCNKPNPQFGRFMELGEKGTKKLFSYADMDLRECNKGMQNIISRLNKQTGSYHVKFHELDNSVSVVREDIEGGTFRTIKTFAATIKSQADVELERAKGFFKKAFVYLKNMGRSDKQVKSNIFEAAEYATKMNK